MSKKKSTKSKTINGFTCTLMDGGEIPVPEEKPATSENEKPSSLDKEIPKTSKKHPKKDHRFYAKCAEKRKEKGMIILPKNVETKIYKLKKSLQKKNLDAEEIRQIIRKKRREEELKFRKDLKHLCFRCRKPGHSISNCPQKSTDNENDDGDIVDICYYCGAADHKLSECSKYQKKLKSNKTSQVNLPYVKCFICHQQGHLTRNCPKNEKGAFPKGGQCRGCGSVNHAWKECPENNKKDNNPEPEISLQTYDNLEHGVDVDDYLDTIPTKSTNLNKNKMVVF